MTKRQREILEAIEGGQTSEGNKGTPRRFVRRHAPPGTHQSNEVRMELSEFLTGSERFGTYPSGG